jgi:hypothetical protein
MMFGSRVFSLVAIGLAAFSGIAHATPTGNNLGAREYKASLDLHLEIVTDLDEKVQAAKNKLIGATKEVAIEVVYDINAAVDAAAAAVYKAEADLIVVVDEAHKVLVNKVTYTLKVNIGFCKTGWLQIYQC